MRSVFAIHRLMMLPMRFPSPFAMAAVSCMAAQNNCHKSSSSRIKPMGFCAIVVMPLNAVRKMNLSHIMAVMSSCWRMGRSSLCHDALDDGGLGGARRRCLIKKARQRALPINDTGLFNIRDNMHRAPSHTVMMAAGAAHPRHHIMSINAILQGNDETALVQTVGQGGTHFSEVSQFGGEQNNIGGCRSHRCGELTTVTA